MKLLKTVDIIFVLVNYNTEKELIDFINSLKNINAIYELVVVNNFSDKKSLKKIKQICNSKKVVLLESENIGYGNAINKGIDFVKIHYKFKYLITSNCDIEIKEFEYKEIYKRYYNCHYVIAPMIANSNFKMQNPFYRRKNNLIFFLFYLAAKYRNRLIFRFTILISNFGRFNYTSCNIIYAAHGSFIMIPKEILNSFKNEDLFDPDIFLLCEELVFAEKIRRKGYNIIYDDNIKILHKEQASMGYLSISKKFEIWSKSYLVFYNKYIKGEIS